MKLSKIICTLAAIAATTAPAYAQFDATTDMSVPVAAWDNFKLNPKTRVQLDFRNASADAVIQTLSKASGIPIIKDPTLTGGLTLQSPKPLSLDDAFAMFNAILNLKGFTMTQQYNFLIIKAKPATPAFGSGRGGGGGFGGFGGSTGGASGAGGGRGAQSVLKVYAVTYASATDLAKTINDLYSNSANTQNNNQGGPGGFPGFGGFGGGGGNGGGGGGGRRGGGGANSNTVVTASADDFSNSLFVNAPQTMQGEIADIIHQVDHPTTQPQLSVVYKLQYATAANLVTVVQNVLSGTTPVGRGSNVRTPTNNNNGGGGGRFGFFGGGGGNNNSQNANGTVSSDTLSNSLVVTTTSQTQQIVSQVIAKLDKPAVYESTSFVYTLQNARADVVANLLNESFGNRTTNGPTGGALTTTGTSQPTVSSTRTSTSTTGGSSPATLGGNTTNGNNNNNNNSNISRTGSTTTSTTGYDTNGQVVNIRDLTNAVVLVPNIDTNSVIVVTNPENWPIIKGILQQLDQIPEQVMIQTLVVEATLDNTDQLGVEWTFNQGKAFGLKNTTGTGGSLFGLQAAIPAGVPASATSLGSTGGEKTNTSPSGLTYTLSGPGFSAFVQALKTDTRFNVLSTPRIFTTNNATAQINISQSLPYVTSSTVDPTTGSTLFNYAFLDVGIILTVTPRITSNGYVTMDVDQSANELQGYQTAINAPIVNQREATTTVSVKDGETIVLGGIMSNQISDTENKVPVLGDLPLIGGLFRSTNKSKNKTELLVFLTPHVVRDPQEARKLQEEVYDGMSAGSKALVKIPTPPADDGPTPIIPANGALDGTTGPTTLQGTPVPTGVEPITPAGPAVDQSPTLPAIAPMVPGAQTGPASTVTPPIPAPNVPAQPQITQPQVQTQPKIPVPPIQNNGH
jgi:general secretion pathway protein D